ncbi:MAG: class I SAM-dependent methyltransferase [Elusimicrobiota bacterium]|nr:class I SAM-dependent methyltransferase [Elusimicrobiota bacterium]
MNPGIYEELARVEEKHFWMRARAEYITSIFEELVAKKAKIIEIGSSTGNIARVLAKSGYSDVAAGDVHASALAFAGAYGIKNLYQFDMMRSPFREHFEAVGMFDVFEHLDDEAGAVENILRMLKPGGLVLATVPAHMWLWNREDAVASHRRRYTVSRFRSIFEKAGLSVLKARYFFASIVPLLLLRSLSHRDRGEVLAEDFMNRFKVNTVINLLLGKLLDAESRFFSKVNFCCGGSVLLVARKNT